MKNCQICLQDKPVEAFGRNAAKPDGLSIYCRDCAREKSREYGVARGYRRPAGWERKTADMAAYTAAWKAAHPGYDTRAKKEWLAKNPARRKAQDAYRYALKVGKLTRLPCEVCGKAKADGHHTDYSKPLQVVWLCREHHRQAHREAGKFQELLDRKTGLS